MSSIQVQKIKTLTGHKDSLYTLHLLNDHEFLSAGGDGMVVRWDINNPETGQMVVKVPASVYALAHAPERNSVVVGQNFSGVHLIDLKEKRQLKSIKLTSEAIFDICATEELILIGTGDGELIATDWELNVVFRKRYSAKSLRAIDIHVDRKEVAVGYSDNHIRILNLEDLTIKHEFEAHTNSVFTLAFHPELPLLLSGGRDARLRFWDIDRNYAQIEEIVAHMYTINHITFSPNRQYFVSCSMDKSIKVWDARSFKLLKVIDKARHAGHGTSVNKLLWLNHRETLVSCSDDRTISLWDINFTS